MKVRERALLGMLALASAGGLTLWLALAPGEAGRRAALDPVRPAHGASDRAPPPAQARASAPTAAGEQAPSPDARTVPERVPERTNEAARRGLGRIAGRVVLADGATPAPGIAVLLGEGPIEVGTERALALLHAPDPDHLVRTGADGRFSFGGLDSSQSYSLAIGGAGSIGAQPRWVVRPDRTEATYRLHYLYGALIRMREPGGRPLRLHGGLQGQRLGRSTLEFPGAFPLHGTPAAVALAGIGEALLGAHRIDQRLILYTSSQAVDVLGPIRFRADYPGYEVVEFELEARQVAHGISEYDLELAPTAAGFGTLVIDVRGWTGACPTFENPRGAAALLRLQSTRGELMNFELEELAGPRVEVHGIPYGEWRALVMFGSRATSVARRDDQSQSVVIGPAPARYDLDLSGAASLVLNVTKADGAPHAGHLSFLYALERGHERAWRTQHFLGPPYRIDELEPGGYRLVLQLPFDAGTSPDRPLQFTARGGQCTQVELREQ